MFQFGVDPRVAVATNMLALTFMSVGGALPSLRAKMIEWLRRIFLAAVIALALSARSQAGIDERLASSATAIMR